MWFITSAVFLQTMNSFFFCQTESVSYSKKWEYAAQRPETENAAQRPETETLNNGVFNVACVGPEAQDLRHSSFFSHVAFQSDVSRPGPVLTLKKERA